MTLNDHSDIDKRRQTLVTRPNPGLDTDYAVTLNETVMIRGLPDPIKFRIRYVPDQVVLDPGSLDDYTGQIRRQDNRRCSGFDIGKY